MRSLLAITFTWICLLGPSAQAQVTVKLATLAPDGTVWHDALEEMGASWQQRTDGRVRLRIYPGGVAGDDPDMVRKMRIGQLHGALLTVAGLAEIDPSINVFTIPLFYESYEEYAHVQRELTATFASRFDASGYVFLGWAHGGWIHLFSKEPVRTVDDLRRTKIFTWAGDDSMIQVWKSNGFRPVALASTDILTGLQTGLIDGIPTTPLAALTLQWYRQTPYMAEKGVAPLVGALLVSKRTWEKISEADRKVLREAAARASRRMSDEIPRLDREAVAEMQQRGLTVVPYATEGAASEQWHSLHVKFANHMREALVPKELFDRAERLRDEFRSTGADP